MIPESKILEILIALGVLIFILINHSRIKKIPNSNILLSAFSFLFFNNIFAILEELFLGDLLNIIQHSCLAISSILLTIWCLIVFTKRREENESHKHY